MIHFVDEDEFSERFVIHEKNGKLKAYYYDSEIIKRYQKLIAHFLSKRKIDDRFKNVTLLYKPRYANS